jgi:hypothetical protein
LTQPLTVPSRPSNSGEASRRRFEKSATHFSGLHKPTNHSIMSNQSAITYKMCDVFAGTFCPRCTLPFRHGQLGRRLSNKARQSAPHAAIRFTGMQSNNRNPQPRGANHATKLPQGCSDEFAGSSWIARRKDKTITISLRRTPSRKGNG